jgi:hypothetical protein
MRVERTSSFRPSLRRFATPFALLSSEEPARFEAEDQCSAGGGEIRTTRSTISCCPLQNERDRINSLTFVSSAMSSAKLEESLTGALHAPGHYSIASVPRLEVLKRRACAALRAYRQHEGEVEEPLRLDWSAPAGAHDNSATNENSSPQYPSHLLRSPRQSREPDVPEITVAVDYLERHVFPKLSECRRSWRGHQ